MNETPKLVVSSTLKTVEWANSSLVTGNLADELAKLKRAGKNIRIPGSPTLVESLLRDGLLDELALLVHPIVVGGGRRLFEDGTYCTALRLVESRSFGTGVVSLRYASAIGPQVSADEDRTSSPPRAHAIPGGCSVRGRSPPSFDRRDRRVPRWQPHDRGGADEQPGVGSRRRCSARGFPPGIRRPR